MNKQYKKNTIITIDGPAASGKSTIAKMIAHRLHFYYLNTGLLYRALAYILTKVQGFDQDQLVTITKYDLLFVNDIVYSYASQVATITYKGTDITSYLVHDDVAKAASIVASIGIIRQSILDMQRAIGRSYSVVADGRDCGSAVFPDADIKFFLIADLHIRAERVMNDLQRHKINVSIEKVMNDLLERDQRDRTRAVAPLIVPRDALVVNNSVLTIDQTVELFLMTIKEKLAQ